MQKLRLRPHHALCMQFFCGHGYSEDFTNNMKQILAEMRDDTIIEIANGADDVCSHCPNLKDGVCLSEKKVSRYDSDVLRLCGFNVGQVLCAEMVFDIVREHIICKGKLEKICSGCEWIKICLKRENN